MVARTVHILALATMFISFALPASAGDGNRHGSSHFSTSAGTANVSVSRQDTRRDWRPGRERAERAPHDGGWRDRGRHHDRGGKGGVIGGDGLPSVLPGIGTYSGSVVAARVPGVGNYFAVDGFGGGDVVRAPKSRIIFVEDGPDCSWEAGVCVIRPR